MGRNANYAAVKDALIKPNKEGSASLGMEQRSNYAAVKDVQITSNEEECVRGMEQIRILMTNLLHSRYMDQDMMKRL